MKKKNSCNKEAAFVGAMIIALIFGFLDDKEKMRGTTIRLKQALLSKLRFCDMNMAKLANIAFQRVLTEIEGKGLTMYASTVIESLFFASESKMRAMYGNEISNIVSNFTIKIDNFGDDEEVHKNSYKVADMLSLEFKKEAEQ